MLKQDKEPVDMLDHVVKGVHVYGTERKSGRVVPRPLDRIDDRRQRASRRKPSKPRHDDDRT